jgi:hypothetical protein
MTKAMYNIGKTFAEMIVLHQKEVENHQNLIEQFTKAKGTEEENTIYALEALRNKEHQKGHNKMIAIYQMLLDEKVIYKND